MARILMLTMHGPAMDPAHRSTGLDSDTQVTLRRAQAAPDAFLSAHDWALADLAVLAAGQDAENEGFDAVCVGDMGDYGVAALRSVLTIPVIGAGRSAMLHALTLGSRFSVLAPSARAYRIKKLAGDYGLDRQCASVRPLADDALARGETMAPRIVQEARGCLDEDGAEVLCVDADDSALASRLADELGAPVVDPLSISLKLAESFLGLHLSHSRRAYPEPQVRKQALIAAIAAVS